MPKTPSNTEHAAIYAAALEGLELQRQRIDEQIQLVKSMLAGGKPAPAASTAAAAAAPKKRGPKPKRAKRVLSPEARKRIADAQKKRWAAFRSKKEK
jgi:hypothetical protein